jgi:ribosomal protein L11 methyltransferase
MKWTEVRIDTTEEAYDAVSEMLTSIGAGGVVIEDPNDIRRQVESPGSLDYADDAFLDSLGEDVVIKAYFRTDSSNNELVSLIREKLAFIAKFLDTGRGYAGCSEVDDEDWATAWKKHYKPFHISDRLVIRPSWEKYRAAAGETVIELDPGMAFGTGTHETTRLCAQLLEKYVSAGDTVIDVGCGTGILSIAAAKLGAGLITAVDIDEVAVRVAGENCRINGVEKGITVVRGALADLEKKRVDIIVANIIADVIIEIADDIKYYLKNDGIIITSGIIRERRENVLEAYASRGFVREALLELGEWVAIVFRWQGSL